ncbi:hypothetical protein MELE44368_02285 [Mycolicibacterium elephantis DSM 44368]|uniref:Uncharacterized protein n=1 Tax=Mycolicibacterium elephantis DSM 44368 TaxID=1335622 RepID=A0A439E112_9MYCO|nr:hypothetical protein MELE44368_02285 [Mycolicibacterium elephantis DSM 44368]
MNTYAAGPVSRSRAWPSTTTSARLPNATSSACARIAAACSFTWETMS